MDLKELISKLTNTPLIIEQGTSGNWKYRKWSNGTAECWGNHTLTVTSWSGWYSLQYCNPYTKSYNYPSGLFTEAPTMTVSTVSGIVGMVVTETAGTKDHTPYIYSIRPDGGGTGAITYAIHAIGRWK